MAFFTSTTVTTTDELLTSFSIDRSSLFPATSTRQFESTETSYFYLTSRFTPPSECWDRIFTSAESTIPSAPVMWDYEFGDSKTLTCSHPEWISQVRYIYQSTFSGARDIDMTGVCPVGYETVGTRVPTSKEETYSTTSYLRMEVPVTQAWCCPSGFTAANFDDIPLAAEFGCESVLETSTSVYYLSEGTTYERNVTSVDVYDRGYIMWWNELQLPYFTPKSAPVAATDTGGDVHSYPQTIESTMDLFGTTRSGLDGEEGSSDSWDGGGGSSFGSRLSKKTIGVIVGGVLGGLVAGVVGIGACIRQSKKGTSSQTTAGQTSGVTKTDCESTGLGKGQASGGVQELRGEDRTELHGDSRQELYAHSQQDLSLNVSTRQDLHPNSTQELHADYRHELDAGSHSTRVNGGSGSQIKT